QKIFSRKKNIPLACSMTLENEDGHIHTGACFIDIQPLSVVELFRSQGCASCPPALPNIRSATMDDHNVLLLTYDVTYFDNEGWTDTFGNRQWDQRQRAYVSNWGRNNVFTPQIIVDGIADGTGAAKDEVHSIVHAARQVRGSMQWRIIVDTNETEIRVDSDLPQAEMPHDILLIMYAPAKETVKVKKGANKGKKIDHYNTVKSITKIGEWMGGNLTVPLPEGAQKPHGGLEIVAVVQAGMGGPILASQKL
ncbi:hypothetical protein BJ875DRAFT_389437, partial [Amylocarpus encephaloides]